MIKNIISAFVVGFIFALGLSLAGMTNPQKVLGFLNVLQWDPSLVFVMVGAILVHSIAYPLTRKLKKPLFDTTFHVPNKKEINPALVIGATIFGIGWGLAGICPGPGITAAASGNKKMYIFLIFMLAGMFLFKKLEKYLPYKK